MFRHLQRRLVANPDLELEDEDDEHFAAADEVVVPAASPGQCGPEFCIKRRVLPPVTLGRGAFYVVMRVGAFEPYWLPFQFHWYHTIRFCSWAWAP